MKAFEKIKRPYKLRLADTDTVKKRLSICKKCDYYSDGRCSLCNCMMTKKAWFQEAECSTGKWEN